MRRWSELSNSTRVVASLVAGVLVAGVLVSVGSTAAEALQPVMMMPQELSNTAVQSATSAPASVAASAVPMTTPAPPPAPTGPYLSAGGFVLDANHTDLTFTARLENVTDIVGSVTWLVDDHYVGVTSVTPPQWVASVAVGSHKLKARWVDSLGATLSTFSTFVAGPYLTSGSGVALDGGNVASPFEASIAIPTGISGDVTWLLDNAYLGKDTTAPYSYTVTTSLGAHKLTARWVTTGTSTAQIIANFAVQTDLNWKAPSSVYEQPGPAMENLWLTSDNRRAPIPGLYDWSKAGFGGGATLPSDDNVRTEATCQISAAQMSSVYGVVPGDGVDDTNGIQAAIDHVRTECSPTGDYTKESRILLPAGTLNVSHEIHVDADYVIIRGAGSNPATGTHLIYAPDANTRYDTITADGTQWDQSAMTNGAASGGWLWPGRGLFRVQSRQVAPQYAAEYASAPTNRKDLYEGTINDHWTTGLTLRSKPGDAGFAARKGDTTIYLATGSTFDNLQVGGLVNVMAANSIKFYQSMDAYPTTFDIENQHMRQQIFMVTAGDPIGKTITIDKPLEFDVPVNSTSDGSAQIDGIDYASKVSPLVDAVVGVGIEDLSFTQSEPTLDAAKAVQNYGNMDPAGAMNGIVFKWAANDWVKGVEADMTGSHPIVTEDAANLSIIDNQLNGSWNKGKGGNGYFRGSRVWDSIYAGNTTRDLRHFTFQWSSSGNVAIGNSFDSDMNLHGGYERNNLFELNEVAVPWAHKSSDCSTNCGGEGADVTDNSDWYPIYWSTGQKAVKWSGATGPNNVFFDNYLRKQLGNETSLYQDYANYSDPHTVYQFGVDASGNYQPLDQAASPIDDWANNEEKDYTGGHGVVATKSDPGRSLFLKAPTIAGYAGPNPQPLRRTWGCDCWDGRGMVNTRLAADPVNTATGSLMENFTDLTLEGVGHSLDWERTYNSLDDTVGPFGQGWTFAFNQSISNPEAGVFYFRDGSGAQTKYTADASGNYTTTDPGVTATMTNVTGGGWLLTNHEGEKLTFNSSGQLITDLDQYGRGITATYASGKLTTLTDQVAQTFALDWGTSGAANGHITKITASDGRSVSYDYTATAGDNRLTGVTGVDGKETTYSYDTDTGLLDGITDPLGHVLSRNTYDPVSHRVVAQKDARGKETRFDWDAENQTANITDPDGTTHKDIYQGNVLVSQTDASGRSTDIYYNDQNQPVAENTAEQQLTKSTYDAAGNLTMKTLPSAVSDASPLFEAWTYDSANRVTSHSDALGHVTSYTYDSAGQLSTVTDAAAGVTSYAYNSLGLVTSVTDPKGLITTNSYTSTGDLESTTSPGGHVTSYTHDARHNQTSQTDPRGNVAGASAATKEKYTSHWSYDVLGNVLTSTDAQNHVTTNEYDDLAQLTSTVAPDDGESTFTYDANGNVLTATDPYGQVVTNTYDSKDRKVSSTSRAGAKTTWTYDDLGQVSSTVDPLGNVAGASANTVAAHTQWFDYDASGNLTTTRVSDPNAAGKFLASTTTYDLLGRPLSATDPSGAVTTTSYDATGNPLVVTDPTGVQTITVYDALGRVQTRQTGGVTTTATYDSDGNVTRSETGGGSVTTFTYGSDGELVTSVDPRGNAAGATATDFTTTYAYDDAGNRTTSTDGLGRVTRTAYNANGQVVKVTDADGHETSYAHDTAGHVDKVTTPTGAITAYSYDKVGNLKTLTNPKGGETTYVYDSDGQLTSTTSPAGRTTGYSYDANGQVTQNALPSGSITYQYDAIGRNTAVNFSDNTRNLTLAYGKTARPSTVSNGTSSSKYQFDSAGRILSVVRGSDTSSYTYDTAGRLTNRTEPDGRTQSYTWGNDATLASTSTTMTGNTQTMGYTYDAGHNVTGVLRSNGPSTTRTLNAANQVTAISDTLAGNTIDAQAVVWTPGGRPSRVTTTRGSTSSSSLYSYDAAGQLTDVCTPSSGTTCASGSPETTITYDDNGNRTALNTSSPSSATTYSYNADDQLISSTKGDATPTTYSYDANGRLTTQASSAGTRTYAYALDGNLNGVALENGQAVTYGYSEAGNRTSRAVNGTVDATWTWDTVGPQAFRTKQGGGTVIRWFEDPQSGLGTAAEQVSSTGAPTWLLSDYLGSITTQTSATAVTGTAKFDAFGNTTATTGGSATNPLGFQGQYIDATNGLYDMRARDYDPATSRFTSPDPQSGGAGTAFAQTYAFASNDPTAVTDPSGACPFCIVLGIGALVGAAIGGIAAFANCDKAHTDCLGETLTGAGVGALSVVLAMATRGASVPGELAILAGIGAGANIAQNDIVSHIRGKTYSMGDAAVDGLYGAAGGVLSGGAGRALSKGASKFAAYLAEQSRVAKVWKAANEKPYTGNPAEIACVEPAQGAAGPAKTETGLVKYKAWPDFDGFLGGYSKSDILQPGQLIDRYGSDGGRFVSPEGTTFGQRGLPSSRSGDPYSAFEVWKPIEVRSGIAGPWMDSGGGGLQFRLPASVQDLLEGGFIGRIG